MERITGNTDQCLDFFHFVNNYKGCNSVGKKSIDDPRETIQSDNAA